MRTSRSNNGDAMDVLYLLDRLEEVLASGRHVPFSSQTMLDTQECLDVVDQLRLALPDELKQSRRVLTERDRILTEAERKGAQLVQRAEAQAAERIDDHTLVQAAEERARAQLEHADREAAEIRRQADDYAYRVFANLDRRLRQIQEVVKEGLSDLRSDRREPDEE